MAVILDLALGDPKYKESTIRAFGEEIADKPLYNLIFNDYTDDKDRVNVLSTPDLPNYSVRTNKFAEISDFSRDGGDEKTFTHARYALRIDRARDDIADNPSLMMQFAGMVGSNAAGSIEEQLTSVLTGAEASTTIANGEYLSSGTHALEDGGTASNRTTTAISHAQMAIIRGMMYATDTDAGRKVSLPPKFIATHPQNFEAAFKVCRAGVVDAGLQPTSYQGAMTPVMVYYSDDTDDFFVVTDKGKHSLRYYMREAPTLEQAYVLEKMLYTTIGSYRISLGAVDWRGIVFGNV